MVWALPSVCCPSRVHVVRQQSSSQASFWLLLGFALTLARFTKHHGQHIHANMGLLHQSKGHGHSSQGAADVDTFMLLQ